MAPPAPKLAPPRRCVQREEGKQQRYRLIPGTTMATPIAPPKLGQMGIRQSPCRSLPIVSHFAVTIRKEERHAAKDIAERLLAQDRTLDATDSFGSKVTTGLGPWPGLVIEDHSQIALFEPGKEGVYEYRALLLAGQGDLVAIGINRNLRFESYCRRTLGLGEVKIVTPRPGPESLAFRCAEDTDFIAEVAAMTSSSGGLNLVPYMGTGGVWKLAARIAEATGQPVRVAAPPPRLVRKVNDKLWFADRVTELLGGAALPPALPCHGLAALTGRVASFARDNAHVAIKVPSSASSMGNVVLDSQLLSSLSLTKLRNRLESLLRRTRWRGEFPLMVTAWEDPILASPSVQLWIPKRRAGKVVVEGIFDQSVGGLKRVFIGAMPSALSPIWQARLVREAAQIATLFQALGYFGRCSFDAILVGESEENACLHWLECNGRWGGTSMPMTLANRLTGDWKRRPFVIIDRNDIQGPGQEVGAFLESISEELYLPDRRDLGAVLLSPGQIERGSGYELMVLGTTLEEARRQAENLARRLNANSDLTTSA